MSMTDKSVIYKYQVYADDKDTKIPWVTGRTKILHVQVRSEQPDVVDVWVFHEGGLPSVSGYRLFLIVGTGHWFDSSYVPVGTTPHPTLPLVWHVLQRREQDDEN